MCPSNVDPEYAVVDVETTGCGNKDRIVEIAIVILDKNLKTVDEYDTLIDPMRDVGPVHVHGIQPTMLANAPTFEDVAAAIKSRISDRILVAHNLPFDLRFVGNEYKRLHASFHPGRGICTLQETGESLQQACRRFGINVSLHIGHLRMHVLLQISCDMFSMRRHSLNRLVLPI